MKIPLFTKPARLGKTPSVVVASTLGFALLIGGGSYALWNSSASSSTQADIQTGTSDLTPLDAGAWKAVRAAGDIAIPDLTAYAIVPGDAVYFSQGFLLKAGGGHADTRFQAIFEDDATTGVAALRARGITFTTSLTDASTQALLGANDPAGDSLNAEFTQLGATPPEGRSITLELRVVFDAAASADDLKKLTALVGNAAISAGQVAPTEAPPTDEPADPSWVAPGLLDIPSGQLRRGSPLTWNLVTAGNPAPTVTVESGSLPDGLTVSSEGVLSGTATKVQEATFTVRAASVAGNATQTYTVYVYALPVIDQTSAPSGTAGTPYTFTMTSTTGSPVTNWSAASALPPGLTLNPVTGVVSGTTFASGSWSVYITATIAGGYSAGQPFNFIFAPAAPPED